MDYLFYLIPGVISYYYYLKRGKSIPPERVQFGLVVKFLIYSALIYFLSYVSLHINYSFVNNDWLFQSDLSTLSHQTKMWIVILSVMIPIIVVPEVKLYVENKFYWSKNKTNGATGYTEDLDKILYVDGQDGERLSRPVRVTIDDEELPLGFLEYTYDEPWEENKEVLIYSICEEEVYPSPVYIYYDATNKIRIEVFDYVKENDENDK